jgi:hypothetical protein
VKTQTCFTLECPDIVTCFSQPSGEAVSNRTCNQFNFYNTIAVGFCGFCIFLISFTGLGHRENAENLKLFVQCRQEDSSSSEGETLLEIRERKKRQNKKLR